MKDESVVITGTGLVCSLGHSALETWDALVSGKDGLGPIEGFDASGFNCQVAAQAHGLNPSELNIHPKDTRIMQKHSYMLMKCSLDAFKQSHLDIASIPGEEIGFFVGMGMVDYEVEDLLRAVLRSKGSQDNINYHSFFSHGYQEIYPLWPLSMLNNISFCQVAINLGIRGENAVFSPHSDSGLQAIGEAAKTLLDKKAKGVLAGGVSENVSPLSLARASLFGILNTAENNSETICRPFGDRRNGTVLGEGCGILVLELHSSAVEREVPCLASITGYGSSFEVGKVSNTPTSGAIFMAMEKAIASAELKPSDIDVVIAHGDGTDIGDRNEIEAIHRVFTDSAEKVNVYSSKGALGHSLAGAPAIDTILGIYILKNGIIPPTCNSLPLDDTIRFNLVSREPLKIPVKRVLINARSYEGQCTCLILEAVT